MELYKKAIENYINKCGYYWNYNEIKYYYFEYYEKGYHVSPTCKDVIENCIMGNNEYKKCCCYSCIHLIDEKSSPECACDSTPSYNKERCMNCPKRSFCDVTENPSNYQQDT